MIAINSYGDTESTCRLNVQVMPRKQVVEEVFEPPKFEAGLRDINILEGYDACFECKVNSKAPYQVKWYKDGHELIETNRIKVSSFKNINAI